MSGMLLFSAAGCKTWSMPTSWTWWKPALAESKAEVPERVVVIWAPDTLAFPGKPPVRGFGGRAYFYNAQDKTIPVDGQLIVYGYDDTKKSTGAQRIPDRKFAFTTDQFKAHYDESKLGPSYSIWLPWDPAGGEQKDISLVPVFTSTSGKVVMGPPGINVLPGKQLDPNQRPLNQVEVTKSTTVDPPVRPATYFDRLSTASQTASGEKPAAKTRTTTIPMNESMSRRMQASAVAETPIERLVPPSEVATGASANATYGNQPVLNNSAWPFAPANPTSTARPPGRFAPRQLPVPAEPNAQ